MVRMALKSTLSGLPGQALSFILVICLVYPAFNLGPPVFSFWCVLDNTSIVTVHNIVHSDLHMPFILMLYKFFRCEILYFLLSVRTVG